MFFLKFHIFATKNSQYETLFPELKDSILKVGSAGLSASSARIGSNQLKYLFDITQSYPNIPSLIA